MTHTPLVRLQTTLGRTDAGYAGNVDAADTPNATLTALQAMIKTPQNKTDATKQTSNLRCAVTVEGGEPFEGHGANPPVGLGG